jgi:hypothetical protein
MISLGDLKARHLEQKVFQEISDTGSCIINFMWTSSLHAEALAESFYTLFTVDLDTQPQERTTVRLFETLKTVMGESETKSFFGIWILELNPDLMKCYWEFDPYGGKLSGAYQNGSGLRHIKLVNNFIVWPESILILPGITMTGMDLIVTGTRTGAREYVMRQQIGSVKKASLIKQLPNMLWEHFLGNSRPSLHNKNTDKYSRLHGNTIPIAAWALMELIKDPSLFQDAREESFLAYTEDKMTGERRIDPEKLVALPILKSIYVEILRLHVSFTVTRGVLQPIAIGGYEVAKELLVQINTEIAHLEEAVWGTDEHPASTFWAARHIKYVKTIDAKHQGICQAQFSMRGRPSSFFLRRTVVDHVHIKNR